MGLHRVKLPGRVVIGVRGRYQQGRGEGVNPPRVLRRSARMPAGRRDGAAAIGANVEFALVAVEADAVADEVAVRRPADGTAKRTPYGLGGSRRPRQRKYSQ